MKTLTVLFAVVLLVLAACNVLAGNPAMGLFCTVTAASLTAMPNDTAEAE